MKCDLTSLVTNGLRPGVTSTNVPSTAVKGRDNIVRALRPNRVSERSLSTIEGRSNNNRKYLKKRKRSQKIYPVSAVSSSSSIADKSVVSEDDDSVSNKTTRANKKRKGKIMKPSPRKNAKAPSTLTPSPLKLNTSQVHSKKYPFPQKLFDLLKKASEENRSSDIVSWSPDGMTFVVHNHARFAAELLPAYFGHTQLRSFDRQLNYWGFELVSPRTINNRSFGGKSWKHPFFQKDRRDLLKQVTRKIAGASSSSQIAPSPHKSKKKPAARTFNKTKSRVVNSRKNKDDAKSDRKIAGAMPMTMNTRLSLKKTMKNLSTSLVLPPRMVSPVHGNPCAESRCNPVQDMIVSALDIVESNPNGHAANVEINDHSAVSFDIEEGFLPLFPLEMFDEDINFEQIARTIESADANGIAPFVDAKAMLRGDKDIDFEMHPRVDIFEGNSFHAVDLNMGMDINIGMALNADMGMEMNTDEADNGDDCFASSHFD